MRLPNDHLFLPGRPDCNPTDSWWVGLPPERFYQRVNDAEEQRRMRLSVFGRAEQLFYAPEAPREDRWQKRTAL